MRFKQAIIYIGTSTKFWMAWSAMAAAYSYVRGWQWSAGLCTGLFFYWLACHFYEQRVALPQSVIDTQKEAIGLQKSMLLKERWLVAAADEYSKKQERSFNRTAPTETK